MCFCLSVQLTVEQTDARSAGRGKTSEKSRNSCAVHRPFRRDSQPDLVRNWGRTMAVGLYRDNVQRSVTGVTKLTCRNLRNSRNKLPQAREDRPKSFTPCGQE
jgi:hypothetical protein